MWHHFSFVIFCQTSGDKDRAGPQPALIYQWEDVHRAGGEGTEAQVSADLIQVPYICLVSNQITQKRFEYECLQLNTKNEKNKQEKLPVLVEL